MERRVLSAKDIARAKKQIEDGNFGVMFDADDALAALASHENLRAEYEDALRRATGHAYATAMAEGGEEIQAQELALERKQHAETLAQLRRFEGALTELAETLEREDLDTDDLLSATAHAVSALSESEEP